MFLSCHYFSHVLRRNTEINVVIPTPEGNEQITEQAGQAGYDYEKGLPVIYLLHGAYGDNCSWMRFSSVERYVQAHRCIAVMAGVGNSFYQDMTHGDPYFTYMTQELPAYITRIFPASKRREDTGIAGFSMGGYGAWFLALSCPALYGKAASMSGALDIGKVCRQAGDGEIDSPFCWEDCFGEAAGSLEGSRFDLLALLKQDQIQGVLPELYQSCGNRDFLFDVNRDFQGEIRKLGIPCEYHEVSGHMHNWDFWDQDIQRILDWMFPIPKEG